jgi:hypothetical protein
MDFDRLVTANVNMGDEHLGRFRHRINVEVGIARIAQLPKVPKVREVHDR